MHAEDALICGSGEVLIWHAEDLLVGSGRP